MMNLGFIQLKDYKDVGHCVIYLRTNKITILLSTDLGFHHYLLLLQL